MTIQILKMGHPLLLQHSHDVKTFNCPDLDVLAERLLMARESYQGAGIAAPQIGIDQRVICYGGKTKRYPMATSVDPMILINPRYEALGNDTEDDWEGCLSVPNLFGLIPRYQRIQYWGFDLDGQPLSGQLDGFLARVFQHEVDHLDGILFVQKIKALRRVRSAEEASIEATASEM